MGNNTVTTYTGNGSTKDFVVLWVNTQLAATHIEVKVNTVVQTYTTHYTMSDDLLQVKFGTAPGNGLAVVLTRKTPHPTSYITFTDGNPVTAANLNDALKQCMLYGEEVEDMI
jgi:hypothetical protein